MQLEVVTAVLTAIVAAGIAGVLSVDRLQARTTPGGSEIRVDSNNQGSEDQ